jgi:glyoxylase-like metal-dependent hydrolase (beta-lactamase superfamily II)
MIRERIADNVYWFQSEIYAQVTAGAIVGPNWAVLVDTLAVPSETLEIRSYLEETLGVQVRYIINTIYHADHTFGNCFFPGATVIGHTLCRQLMAKSNPSALEKIQQQNAEFKKVKIVLPNLTFDSGTLSLQIAKRHIRIFPTAGNSPDGISVLVREDRVLFAGDAFMPIPYFVEGDADVLAETIRNIAKMSLENIVQGHGDVILRGEIEQAARSNLNYLNNLNKVVRTALKRKDPTPVLEQATVEEMGKSRVILGGLVEDLHRRNLTSLYRRELKLQKK